MQQSVEEVGVAELLAGGLLEQRLEPLADLEQPQLLELLAQVFELDGVHRSPPRPSCS